MRLYHIIRIFITVGTNENINKNTSVNCALTNGGK